MLAHSRDADLCLGGELLSHCETGQHSCALHVSHLQGSLLGTAVPVMPPLVFPGDNGSEQGRWTKGIIALIPRQSA